MNVSAKDPQATVSDETIELEPILAERLILFCEHNGQDKATFIARAVELLLDDEEDLILAEQAIEHNKVFPQRYSLDDIKKMYGLDD